MKILEIIREEFNQLTDLKNEPFVKEIKQNGGNFYYVGGFVRDSFLGKDSKDIDILITGIPIDQLNSILQKYGKVNNVGQSFGIIKFIPDGYTDDLDIAIPRIEKSTGDKYTDFEVQSDHTLPIESDLFRRDFSINAIAKDIDGNIIDPFGGVNDLKNKVIRMVNPEAFSDDPLRMLRAIQFSSRFNFTIEQKTFNEIKNNASKIKSITSERILIEFDKIVKKGNPEKSIFDLIETNLYQNIFGTNPNINKDLNLSQISNMGEFIFCLLYDTSINNISDYFKKNMKGDIDNTKVISSIENLVNNFTNDRIKNLLILFNIYNKIDQNIINTKLLNNDYQNLFKEFLKYPKTLKELDVNGNDIMQLGYKGNEITDIFKKIIIGLYSNTINNKKEEILNYVQR